MDRLIAILERAYGLGVAAQSGEVDLALAEEVTSECAELVALLEGKGLHHDDESADPELIALAERLLERA